MAVQSIPGYTVLQEPGFQGESVARGSIARSSTRYAGKLRNPFRILNRNLSRLRGLDSQAVIPAIIDSLEELQRAFEDERSALMAPSDITSDGLPVHGAACPLLGGQYFEIISHNTYDAFGELVYVPLRFSHGLGKAPSGFVNVYDTSVTLKLCIDADVSLGADPSTEDYFVVVPFVEPNKKTYIVVY